jgi:Ras-related protein Rab-33B
VSNNNLIQLQLWDTAGQERFRTSMVKHYYRNTHAVVLVYDVTNASSFDSLKKWVDECNKNCLHDIPRILVGNKCDGVAAVTTNVAQRYADQNNMPVSIYNFFVWPFILIFCFVSVV